MRIAFFDTVTTTKVTETGMRYRDEKSVKIREEVWEGDRDTLFAKFYHSNNRLKYCNGTYFKFVDFKTERDYKENFLPGYNTIGNYYNGGIVD